MAHFAKLGLNSKVEQIVVVDNNDITDESGVEHEELGIELLQKVTGYPFWKQYSYNGSFRKNPASVGMIYDEGKDAFYFPQPYPSWTFDEETCVWNPPVAYPDDYWTETYSWNEDSRQWDKKS